MNLLAIACFANRAGKSIASTVASRMSVATANNGIPIPAKRIVSSIRETQANFNSRNNFGTLHD